MPACLQSYNLLLFGHIHYKKLVHGEVAVSLIPENCTVAFMHHSNIDSYTTHTPEIQINALYNKKMHTKFKFKKNPRELALK